MAALTRLCRCGARAVERGRLERGGLVLGWPAGTVEELGNGSSFSTTGRTLPLTTAGWRANQPSTSCRVAAELQALGPWARPPGRNNSGICSLVWRWGAGSRTISAGITRSPSTMVARKDGLRALGTTLKGSGEAIWLARSRRAAVSIGFSSRLLRSTLPSRLAPLADGVLRLERIAGGSGTGAAGWRRRGWDFGRRRAVTRLLRLVAGRRARRATAGRLLPMAGCSRRFRAVAGRLPALSALARACPRVGFEPVPERFVLG